MLIMLPFETVVYDNIWMTFKCKFGLQGHSDLFSEITILANGISTSKRLFYQG